MVTTYLKRFKILTVSLIAIALTGCATTPTPTANAPLPVPSVQNIQTAWQANQFILKPIHSWEVSGVIGIRVKDKGEGANLFWRVTNENQYIIQIYGTAGLGAISITGRPDGSVIFKDSNGKETYAKNIETLMQERLGWSVPVNGLYYWGRGLPAPIKSKELALNRYGLMSSLEQSGWHIQYNDYRMIQNKYPLPVKMVLTRGDLTLKVIIKSWLINN